MDGLVKTEFPPSSKNFLGPFFGCLYRSNVTETPLDAVLHIVPYASNTRSQCGGVFLYTARRI